MGFLFPSLHEKNIKFKQDQRKARICALPEYTEPLTKKEGSIIDHDVPTLVKLVQNKELTPKDILLAFGKQALVAQEKTNCLTEIMIKDAETWAENAKTSGPLAGIPVSLKDHFIVGGYDACSGYSRYTNQPFKEDGAVVKILKDAGAIPYVKTNVPITMMAIEGYNDIFGRTLNSHNPDFAPGGSSQGEAALLSAGGSRIGMGSDTAGSVRIPAAWSGLCSLKMTSYRWPCYGDASNESSGWEAIPVSNSPMARSLPDLKHFLVSMIGMKPWKYDFELVPLPWREAELPAKPKVGVLTFPEFLPVTPAQQRALDITVKSLKMQGCEVVDFELPSPPEEYDRTINQIFFADGFKQVTDPLLPGEHCDPFVKSVNKYAYLPRCIRSIWQTLLRWFGFKDKAAMYSTQHVSTAEEYANLIVKRDQLRAAFHKYWDDNGFDFLVTPPHQSPALPNHVPDSFRAVLYTSLFNLLDFPAGILPVGRVDILLDRLSESFDSNKLPYPGRVAFKHYDPVKMEELPTAVQVVCKRYEDEKTLKSLEYTYDALKKAGIKYK